MIWYRLALMRYLNRPLAVSTFRVFNRSGSGTAVIIVAIFMDERPLVLPFAFFKTCID